MALSPLKEWRLACPKGPLNLVFPNTKGAVNTPQAIYEHCLGALQVATGLTTDKRKPKYGLHALRHAGASMFIEQMTFDIYGHLFPSAEDDQTAMQQIQARLIG